MPQRPNVTRTRAEYDRKRATYPNFQGYGQAGWPTEARIPPPVPPSGLAMPQPLPVEAWPPEIAERLMRLMVMQQLGQK